MINLQDSAPEVFASFASGLFSINRSGHPFSGVPTDQVLKQTLNKDSKTSGRLKELAMMRMHEINGFSQAT